MPTPGPSRTGTSAKVKKAGQKQILFRKKGPSPEEWERVKPLLRRYYLEEKRKLKEVRTLLLKEHNFDAEEHMLKERLGQWDFKKNFKKKQHEAAAKEAMRRADLGMSLPLDMDIDGKPCAWDRVYRHFGKQYDCSSLRPGSQWDALVSKVALKTSIVDYNIEMTLSELKYYWSVTIMRDETLASIRAKRKALRVQHNPVRLEVGFLGALDLMNSGRHDQGWREMNQMCDAVVQVIRLQEPSLLESIISIFSSTLWTHYPDLFAVVVKHVLSACNMILKAQHPLISVLTTFLNMPQTSTIVDDFTELAFQVMVDTANEQKDHVKLDGYYIYGAEEYLLIKMSKRLPRPEAYELVQAKYSHYRGTLGPRSRHTLSLQIRLAKMHMYDAARMKDPDAKDRKEISEQKGEKILCEIVKQGEKYPQDHFRVGTYSVAAQDLARYFFAHQDFRSAQKYYCLALLWASDQFAMPHPAISLLLQEFDALQKMGELGLVDIEMPKSEQHGPSAEKGGAPSIQDMEVCEVSCNDTFESTEEFEPDALVEDTFDAPTMPYLAPECSTTSMLDSCTELDGGNVLTGPISSEFLPSYLDTADGDTGGQHMQEAYGTYTGDFDAWAPDNSHDLSGGPAGVPGPDLSSFLQNEFAECDLHMDDIDELWDYAQDPKVVIPDDELRIE